MGPLDKYILTENALKTNELGFELQFQSHWYRTLPLSCMDFSLKIDGEMIDNNLIKVVANNVSYTYQQLPNLDKEFLFILDKATIQYPKPLKVGQSYEIVFNLDLYIPYILVGAEGKPLLAGSKVEKVLICQ